uniref:Uncharacterized protein n=1 Tax=Romanomermis culicivorax TaxID=13658 RepID=A0A915HU35_ROMCU
MEISTVQEQERIATFDFTFKVDIYLIYTTADNPKTVMPGAIFKKLSHEPVATAIPSSVTPKQLTRLSWPASTPLRSWRMLSQTLQLKSS